MRSKRHKGLRAFTEPYNILRFKFKRKLSELKRRKVLQFTPVFTRVHATASHKYVTTGLDVLVIGSQLCLRINLIPQKINPED